MSTTEQIYTDLKSILPDLKEAMQVGLNYGGDLFHRFIWWDITKNITIIVILLTCIALLTYFAYKYLFKRWDDWDSDNIEPLFAVMYFLITPMLCLGLCGCVFTLIKAIFIPELRVIEVLSNIQL